MDPSQEESNCTNKKLPIHWELGFYLQYHNTIYGKEIALPATSLYRDDFCTSFLPISY